MCGFYYRPFSISFRVRKCCYGPFILRSKAWVGFVQKSTFHCQRLIGSYSWSGLCCWDSWERLGGMLLIMTIGFWCRIIGLWWSKASVKWTGMKWSFLEMCYVCVVCNMHWSTRCNQTHRDGFTSYLVLVWLYLKFDISLWS